jgi:Xaa-Pro aminopeptidase
MAQNGCDAYLVSGTDAHQSEVVPDYWKTREWLTGFTGSAGLVAVTQTQAALFTDGRYTLQAERQLAGSGFELCVSSASDEACADWLARHLPDGGRLAFDGRTLDTRQIDGLKKALLHKRVRLDTNAQGLDALWQNRPKMPATPAFEHPLRFAGRTAADKLHALRGRIKKGEAYLCASLTSAAWLLNLRGRDIPHTPVVYAFLYVTPAAAHVFIDPKKLKKPLAESLKKQGFLLRGYDEVYDFVNAQADRVLYDPRHINGRLGLAIKAGQPTPDLISQMKAVKSDTEIAHMRAAFLADGAAWVRLLKWLDEWTRSPRRAPLFEADIAERLALFRQKHADYLMPAFDTIAAYGANAAHMHYSREGRGAKIGSRGLLLVDAGSQYLGGTTDITRTVAVGPLSAPAKRDFTYVLKGHIALANALFLAGADGRQLDIIARQPLWQAGLDYQCGTGHGLGYCLSVHEGPYSLSPRFTGTQKPAPIGPGMVLTIEPGVYKPDEYGIRLENACLVTHRLENAHGVFYGFEPLSLVPIDLRCVRFSLLCASEKKWLAAYHQQVCESLRPHLSEAEYAWLEGV